MRPVQIALDARKNVPVAFRWQSREYRIVSTQECWRVVGKWWDGEGERTFYRVLTTSGGIFELCYDHQRRLWSMERVED